MTPVVWVEKAELPGGIETQIPKQFPPLRIDRDTVVLGKMKAGSVEAGKISIVASVAGKSMQLAWNVTPEPSHPDLGFLTAVVERNQADGGLNLPALGSDGLRAMSFAFADSATDMIKSGGFALRSGQVASAAKIAEEALKQDPANAEALGLLNAAKKELEPSDEEVPAGKLMQFGGNAGSPTIQGDALGGADLLSKELELRQAASEAFERDVRVQLRDLRNAEDAAMAKNSLKILLERLDNSADINAATRNQLRDQVSSAIQAATVKEVQQAQRLSQSETLRAQADAAQRAINETRRNEESLKQLVEHFNELMSRHRYLEASKDVSPEIDLVAFYGSRERN